VSAEKVRKIFVDRHIIWKKAWYTKSRSAK